jgi:hypothetical protein
MKAFERMGVWLLAMVLAAAVSLAQDAKKPDASAQENKAAADDKKPETQAQDPAKEDAAKKEEEKPAPLPEVKKGDVVIVVPETANLQRGADIVATASKDQELEVLKVSGNWVGTAVMVEGKRVGGWIHKKYVKVKPVEDGPIEAPDPSAAK